MTGKTISHYRVLEKLGAGGMGVVYRATDLKLERAVALKFLPEHLTRDRDATERFGREARAASALNHEGICTIHEIEEADGLVFLVMELLEGETLYERLARGRLPFPEVLDYAEQLVEALGAAHAKGICHRDIKPGNIFLVAGRRAKILDFGLAKIDRPPDASRYTTIVQPSGTMPGTVAGTVAYMSPEQALGQPVDARTDLFSLGLVLHEMATGRPAFTGATGALYDAILNRNPPSPSTIVTTIPPAFNRIVEKALEKDRTVRYQSAADMGADLKRLRRGDVVAPRSAMPVRTIAAAVAVVAIAAAGVGYFAFGRSADTRPFLEGAKFEQITDLPGVEASPSLSSDGKSVVYASRMRGKWDIYFQHVTDKKPINITIDSTADDIDPAFSPDGSRIAFRSERDGGGLFEMSALGGSVRRISDAGHTPAWSPDQKHVVFATERITIPTTRLGHSVLWKVDVETGQNRLQLTTMDAVQPSWSPNGNRIAYWAVENGERSIWTVPADGGPPARVTKDAFINWNPVWSPDGQYLFFSSDRGGAMNLWRVPIDERTGTPKGSPEPVTTGSSNSAAVSMSRNGSVICYLQQTFARNISRLRFDRPADPPVPITQGTHVLRQPDVSPDGGSIAYSFGQNGQSIFVMQADGSNARRLTESVGGTNNRAPRWSPDGKRIAFYSNRSGSYQVWTIKPDGSDLRQVTNYQNAVVYYPVWSPDGHAMNVSAFDGVSFVVDLGKPWKEQTPKLLPALSEAGTSFVAWSWSPDETALAGWQIPSNNGQSKGIVIYEPGTGRYRQITTMGIYPTWLRDGKRLLFASNEKLFSVDVESGKVSDVPTPRAFANDFSLSRDNQWLYYNEDQREGDVWLITRSRGQPR